MRLREIALEIAVSNHFLKIRTSFRVTQQTLGEKHDELVGEEISYQIHSITGI